MTDISSKPTSVLYYGATPITEDELLENFEQTIDRCAAGETFILIRNGEAVIYMVPYEEYRVLEERANRPTPAE